ncbi:MAG: hypothetical protein HFF38_12970 [Lawsonibacter sp.]|nr:hypothetical protein [Lawsonibacter sp.]
MKLNDMLFVIAHRQEAETNMLMTFGEYRERVLYYWCQTMEGAARHIEEILTGRQDKEAWATINHGKDYGYDVRFCLGEQDLKDFLHGHFNSWPEWYLDTGRCSDECLRALEEYNFDRNGVSIGDTYWYEERERPFGRGGLLRDFDGTEYRIMEYYNQDNLLLFNQETGSLLVAVGVKCYDRYPYAGKASEGNRETGIKWEKAVYLNPVPSQIDFMALKEQYSKMRPEPARQETDREIQEAVSKAGDIPAGYLGETIDRAIEIYKCRIDGSGETQRETRHPALNGRGR